MVNNQLLFSAVLTRKETGNLIILSQRTKTENIPRIEKCVWI